MSMPPGQFGGDSGNNETWRLLLAVSLIAGLWMLWPLVFPAPPTPQASKGQAGQAKAADSAKAAAQPNAAATVAATHLATPTSQPGSAPASAPAPATPRPTEAFATINTPLFEARVSTWGAALTELRLHKFEDEIKRQKGKKAPPVDLVPSQGTSTRSLVMRTVTGTFALAKDAVYELVEHNDHTIVLRHDTGHGVVVTRTYTFTPNSYAFEIEDRFDNKSGTVQSASLELAIAGQERKGERGGGGLFSPRVDQLGWSCYTDELIHELSSKHKDDKHTTGTVSWAGIDRQYFLAAAVPRDVATSSCEARRTGETGLEVSIAYAPITLPGGQSVVIHNTGYFGPKQIGLLGEVGAKLDQAIQFGWFGAISRPLLWLLVFFYGYVGNYGLAIILLTLIVKLVLLPVTQKSFESAERMKKIQPLVKELQAKYKNDRLMASQKQMELFKEHHVSPLGGCLPMALQMPIWIALYRTLYTSVELYQQPLVEGWIDNLAFADPTYVLPAFVTIFMVAQQFFTPVPQDNPSMKYVMWGMPLMFGVIMFRLPAGLCVYILINSVLTVAQQAYIRRKFRQEATPQTAKA